MSTEPHAHVEGEPHDHGHGASHGRHEEAGGHDHGHKGNAGHAHGHNHGGGHAHSHAPKGFGKAFLVGVILNTSFVAAETVYGIRGNSVALLADAGHNLSDVLGLLLAWAATAFASTRPSQRFTYGLRSSSILAALANAVLLLLVTGGIAWEAVTRLRNPEHAEGHIVIVVAAIGVVINLATALMFMSGRKGDLNVRAAFAHMAGDAAIALGVVIAGVAILYTGWDWLDPVVSIVIALLVIVGTWSLLRDSVNLALHAAPQGVEVEEVKRYLSEILGVSQVRDLHIWGLSTTQIALTAHLVMPQGNPDNDFLHRVEEQLHERFGIGHVTVQIESGVSAHRCALVDDGA